MKQKLSFVRVLAMLLAVVALFSIGATAGAADADTWYRKAEQHLASQQYDLAIQFYSKAIAVNPNYAAAYNQRGNAYDAINRTTLAVADYTKAIALDRLTRRRTIIGEVLICFPVSLIRPSSILQKLRC